MKVSFDFDGTLRGWDGADLLKIHELLKNYIKNGDDVCVVTRRAKNIPYAGLSGEDLVKYVHKNFGNNIAVYFTDLKMKKNTLINLGIQKHYDDDINELNLLHGTGINGVLVKEDKSPEEKARLNAEKIRMGILAGLENQYQNNKFSEFYGKVGSGVLIISKKTGRILITLRSRKVNEPNRWSVIGGKLDDGENDPKQAAIREMQEEIGYYGQFELIPAYIFHTPDKSFEYHNFICLVEDEFKPHLNYESSEAKWVTLSELEDISPKHFGLVELLKHSLGIIKKYTK